MENNQQPTAKRDLICGIWYLDLFANDKQPYLVLQKGDLLLQKEPIYPMPADMGSDEIRGWGQRFEFRENGDLVDSYGAPCGNDSQLHRWSGKWMWNEEGQSLLLRIENYPEYPFCNVKPSEEYKSGEEFYITEATRQRIQLSPKHPDAQLWVPDE